MAEDAINLMLECSICQEQFSDPRVLPCQHTFCLLCLEKLIKHQRTKASIPYPICRATYHLLTAGIHGLPKNIFAGNLIDIVGQGGINIKRQTSLRVNNTGSIQFCPLDTDECSQPATVHCDVCDIYMCERCELSHKISKFAKKHKTMIIRHATTRQNQPFCPKHTSKLLNVFCEDCNLILCYICVFSTNIRNINVINWKTRWIH